MWKEKRKLDVEASLGREITREWKRVKERQRVKLVDGIETVLNKLRVKEENI